MRQELVKQLRGDEGVERHVYKDSLGFYTIGVGRLVDKRKPGSGLRPDEIDYLLYSDIDDRIEALTRRLPWFQNLDDARRAVLINMSFQMGVEGLMGFVTTLAHIERGEFEKAADQMLKSKWAQQTPERAARMSKQMRTGQWVFAPGVE